MYIGIEFNCVGQFHMLFAPMKYMIDVYQSFSGNRIFVLKNNPYPQQKNKSFCTLQTSFVQKND